MPGWGHGGERCSPDKAQVPAGEWGEIVLTLNRAADFDFACLLPGRSEAGMVGHIMVAPK